MERTPNSSESEEEVDQRLLLHRAKFVMKYDQPWFFRLLPNMKRFDTGLVGYFGEKKLSQGGVVIAQDVSGEKRDYKMFSWFPSIELFLRWASPRMDGKWHFYEVIGATTPEQKPYFDIDIPTKEVTDGETTPAEATAIAYEYVLTICQKIQMLLLNRYDIRLETDQILIYETVYPEDPATGLPKKFSYHLVVQGLFFSSHVYMREFGHLVKKEVGEKIGAFVDDIWYSTRQFRTEYSGKLGTKSIKRIMPLGFPPRQDGISKTTLFESSFVTNIEGCKEIPVKSSIETISI